MDRLRTLLQQKLEEIQDLETTVEIPDDVLEEGKTYFSFTLQKSYVNGDMDRNYTYRINLTGYLKRMNNPEENTLKIVDDMTNKIEEILKSLNMKTSFQDVTIFDGIRKNLIQGEVMFNEINNTLV